jgi:hypothetical protein
MDAMRRGGWPLSKLRENFMSIASEKLLDRLRKIQALARHGVGGEKENAERMLARLLDLHNLTIEDLDGESKPIEWRFKADPGFDIRLVNQIIYKVTNKSGVPIYKLTSKKGLYSCNLTAAQAIECEAILAILRPALEDHFQIAFSAFVQSNQIFGDSPGDPEDKQKTPEERARDFAIMQMMLGTKKVNLHKQIGSSND